MIICPFLHFFVLAFVGNRLRLEFYFAWEKEKVLVMTFIT